MLALVSCSSSARNNGAQVPTTSANSACVSHPFSASRWPRSGDLTSVVAGDAPALAQRFVDAELDLTDVAATGGLTVSESACTVQVRVGGLQGIVNFIAVSKQKYAVEGFNLGDIGTVSIQVAGRHVDVSYDTQCRVCTSWEMHLRYRDAVTSVGPAPTSHMTADLKGNPSESGGFVFIARLADGSVRSAHAATVPRGDFAAS